MIWSVYVSKVSFISAKMTIPLKIRWKKKLGKNQMLMPEYCLVSPSRMYREKQLIPELRKNLAFNAVPTGNWWHTGTWRNIPVYWSEFVFTYEDTRMSSFHIGQARCNDAQNRWGPQRMASNRPSYSGLLKDERHPEDDQMDGHGTGCSHARKLPESSAWRSERYWDVVKFKAVSANGSRWIIE